MIRHLFVALTCLPSCRTNTSPPPAAMELLIPDTTNNRRAQLDADDLLRHAKIEKQLGLSDLRQGADSLEIRLWYNFSFSNSTDLYILKFRDTGCLLSYYKIYPRYVDYNDEHRNRTWNPYTDPIIDSTISKTVLLTRRDYQHLHWTAPGFCGLKASYKSLMVLVLLIVTVT